MEQIPFRNFSEIFASYKHSTCDHTAESANWYFNDVILAKPLGPFAAGDSVFQVWLSISPDTGNRSVLSAYATQAEVETDQESFFAEVVFQLVASKI